MLSRNNPSCPAIRQLINNSKDEELANKATDELNYINEFINAFRQQLELTQKALDNSALGIDQVLKWNNRLDELQAEIKKLKGS